MAIAVGDQGRRVGWDGGADRIKRLLDYRCSHSVPPFFIWAEKLSRDPSQQILIFIGLFQEEVEQFSELSAGCLIASYTYQFEDLDADIQDISAQAMLQWRSRLGAKFAEVMAKYPPRIAVRAEELADSMVSTFEGAFVMMRVLREPTQLSQQLSHFRNYVELLFLPVQ